MLASEVLHHLTALPAVKHMNLDVLPEAMHLECSRMKSETQVFDFKSSVPHRCTLCLTSGVTNIRQKGEL
jgi:hypothetical protein